MFMQFFLYLAFRIILQGDFLDLFGVFQFLILLLHFNQNSVVKMLTRNQVNIMILFFS